MRRPWRQRLYAVAIGALVLWLALELGLRALALGFAVRQRSFDPPTLRAADDFTVLCLGESTTAMGGPDSWPSQLQGLLQARMPARHVTVINRGVPGVDSSALLAQVDANLARHQPDVVAAMMGANDTWTGAIPWEATPMADRPAQVFKTWKLARQLLYELRRHRSSAGDPGPLEARRWVQVDGPQAEPRSAGTRADGRIVARARSFAAEGDFEGAVGILRAATGDRPQSALLHEELGVVLRAAGRFDEAEAALLRARELDPQATSVLVELAAVANDRANQRADPTTMLWLTEAEGLLRQAIALEPTRPEATLRLARLLRQRDEVQAAITLLEGTPGGTADDRGDRLLVDLYRRAGRRAEAASLLQGVLAEADQPCDPGGADLVDLLYGLGRADEGRAVAKELASACADDPTIMIALAEALHGAGEHAWATRVEEHRDTLQRGAYCPLTHRSYQRLSTVLGDRGILLVAVQYPRRPVATLERYVQPRPGVVLVDDERAFEDAVAREGYDAIFLDHCYGDFGHATARGNLLLAERVADAIVGAIGQP